MLVQCLPQEAGRQQKGRERVRREVACAYLGDVRVLLRHDGPISSHRREDVLDQRRRTQHDVAVAHRRHLRTSLSTSADSSSQADSLWTAKYIFVTDFCQ